MILKELNDITIDDLQHLIDESFLEMKTLEYKEKLQTRTDGEKKEFLADISSFANSNGGDIIYGIREEDHLPKQLVGIEIDDLDKEINRIDQILLEGIRPRIPDISIHPIPISTNKYAIIFRIPKSWLSPHMIKFQDSSKFYARLSNGKYLLGVDELRSAFTLSESKVIRIKEFIQSRIAEILSENYPFPMTNYPKIIMHIVPLSSIEFTKSNNFQKLNYQSISPLFMHNTNNTYTIDGYLSYTKYQDEDLLHGYVLIFHNGSIEAVSSIGFRNDVSKTIPTNYLENSILDSITSYLTILKIMDIEPPYYLFIHLYGLKGYSLFLSPGEHIFHLQPIQKDFFALPNVELVRYRTDYNDKNVFQYLTEILKFPFDALSNAFGLPRSRSYSNEGKWNRY